MDKRFLVVLVLWTLFLSACTKEENGSNETTPPALENTNSVTQGTSFNIVINHQGMEDQTTKAVKTGWENGDVVYVFFSKVASPKYLKMTFDGTTWSSVEMNGSSEGSIGLAESGTMTAVYLPFANNATISVDGEAFSFSKCDYAYYLTCIQEPYTVSDNVVSGTLNMSVPDGFVQFFIPDTNTAGNVTLSDNHMAPSAAIGVAADGSLLIENKSEGESMNGYAFGDGADKGYLFSGILSAEARNVSTNYHFILVTNGQTKLLDGTKTLYRGTGGSYTHRAIKLPPISSWSNGASIPGKVDLGLSIKWASFNLGATSPKGYGDYYAWGETATKSSFSWSGYKWCNGSSSSLTKYNNSGTYGIVDNKKVLEAADDAAHFKLGGNWRIPTSSEWDELISNCTAEYYYNSGTYGWKLTSRINGNSVFLPLSGSKSEWGLNGSGSSGFYLSSSLNTDNPILAIAAHVDLNSLSKSNSTRCDGVSVRPVFDDRIHPVSVSLNQNTISLYEGGSTQLTATVLPGDATDKSVEWSSSDTDIASVSQNGTVTGVCAGNATITATTKDGSLTATCSVTVISVPVPGAVDLGLSVKWANCNLSKWGFVSSPVEYGDYYAWGETEPYYSSQNPLTWKTGKSSGYDWGSYQWSNNNGSSFTKYVTAYNGQFGTYDGKGVLDSEDDAALAKLGGNWRMPTYAECNELVNNCTWIWVTNYNGSGVNGRLVTSNTNGNSIFLPAAGCRLGTGLYEVGEVGYYWSSSVYWNAPEDAYFIDFTSNKAKIISVFRNYGFQIRPVCD